METRLNYKIWTDQEEEFLKDNYHTLSLEELSNYLNRPKSSVAVKANRSRLFKNKSTWTKEEEQIIKDNIGKLKREDIYKLILNHSSDATRGKIERVIANSKKNKKKDSLHYNYKLYRQTMEEKIGRGLEKHETVHHIDIDHYNNDPSNLYLYKNKTDHLNGHHSLNQSIKGLLLDEILCFNEDNGNYDRKNESQFYQFVNKLLANGTIYKDENGEYQIKNPIN